MALLFTANVEDLHSKVWTLTDEPVQIVSITRLLSDMADIGSYDRKNRIEVLGSFESDYTYNLGYLIPMAFSWLLNTEHHYNEC